MNNIFSIPLYPKLRKEEEQRYILEAKAVKNWIYDIYITIRIPPFMQDAMGVVFKDKNEERGALEQAIRISSATRIRLSATFNNILVRPTQDNLDLWIKNFSEVYSPDIFKSVTLPHSSWVATGQVQKAFPDIEIKNTVIRNVTEAKQIVGLAKAGFNYINLYRDLMRDHDKLKIIKKAKELVGVKVAILGNEGCAGNCTMADEHYAFNNTNVSGISFFNDPISRVSCEIWESNDSAYALKVANIPPWREDWDELLEYIDVIKMHGRESKNRMWNSLLVVTNYANNEEMLFDDFEQYLDDAQLRGSPINVWRKKIKTCKFDCWDCNYCEQVYESKKEHLKTHPVANIVANEIINSVNNTGDKLKNLMTSLGSFHLLPSDIFYCGNGFESPEGNVDFIDKNLHLFSDSCVIIFDNANNMLRDPNLGWKGSLGWRGYIEDRTWVYKDKTYSSVFAKMLLHSEHSGWSNGLYIVVLSSNVSSDTRFDGVMFNNMRR